MPKIYVQRVLDESGRLSRALEEQKCCDVKAWSITSASNHRIYATGL